MACPQRTARAAPATTRHPQRQQPKLYPGQPSRSGRRPGSPVPPATPQRASARHASRRRRRRPRNKSSVPPAMAGTVPGQPLRRRLKVDDDAFGAVGDYAGSFLIKGGLELSTGYDTNPARLQSRSARRSMSSRPIFSSCPTGSATRWSLTCAARSRATPTTCRRRSTALLRRRRSRSTAPISPAMSTAASTSIAISS